MQVVEKGGRGESEWEVSRTWGKHSVLWTTATAQGEGNETRWVPKASVGKTETTD